MIRLVVMLSAILIFTGCSCNEQIVNVPQKCTIPTTEKPIINNDKCDDNNYSCVVKRVLLNYEVIKQYAEKLEINSKVCQ